MDREGFKVLSDIERIEWFKAEYSKEKKHADIVKEYNLAKNTVGDTFRRQGYVMDKALNQYVLNDITCYNMLPHVIKQNDDITENQHVSNIEAGDLKNKDLALPSNVEEQLFNMIKWYKEQQAKEAEREELLLWVKSQMDKQNIIEIPEIDIKKELLTGEIKTRSFTIYSDVLDKFLKFCGSKSYSKQDILSMALLEYMERYK